MVNSILSNLISLFKKKSRPPLSLAVKTGALAFLTFILFAGITYLYLIPRLEQVFINKKKEMLKTTVDMLINHINYYHQKTLKDSLTTSQAKKMAADLIRHCRYGKENKDYFWINDMQPVMIVHPYKSELEGRNLSEYEDPSGKKVFMDMITEVKDDEEGFVQYEWQWKDREKHILPKISYVKKFAPWNWVIGTGMYIKDIETELSIIKARITWIFAIVMAVIIIVLSYITRQSSLSEKKRLRAEKEIKSSQELMEAILETTQDGILVGNTNGTFSYANTKFFQMWNIPPEVIHTKSREHLSNAVWNQLKNPRKFFSKLQKLYESTDSHLDQVEFKDGRVFERFSAPLKNQGNGQIRVWSFRDTTEEIKNKTHIKHLNSLLLTIRDINQLIVMEPDIKTFMPKACDILIEARLYVACAIGLIKEKNIEPYAQSGKNLINSNWYINQKGEGEAPDCIKNTIQSGKIHTTTTNKECISINNKDRPYTLVLIPMIQDKQSVGIIIVAINAEKGVTRDELNLLQEIADDLTFAREKSIAQNALIESEKKFRNLSEMLPDVVFETDINFNITYANKKAFQLFGYHHDDLSKGLSGIDMFAESERERIMHNYNKKLQGIHTGPVEHQMKKKNGSIFPALFHTNFIYKENTKIGIRGVIIDLTEKYKTKEALEESEHKYRILVNSSPNIIMTFENGRCTFTNPAAQNILQYEHHELIGQQITDLIAAQNQKDITNMIDKLFKGKKINDSEIKMKRKDSKEIFVNFFIIHPSETATKDYFILIAKDITYQKETERNILNAVIETQERERKAFAENLHDELGPFLSGIKFYVDEITHDGLSPQKNELANYLKKMTNEAISIIRSVSNQLMPNILINYGLYKAINTFIGHLQIINKININLTSNQPQKKHDPKIELTLYRVIIELINNTLKHANATNINILFHDNDSQLCLTYEDNGKGFNFENYIIGGKGLGLQNIMSRIKLINGEIHFKSKQGKGFNVNIILKL